MEFKKSGLKYIIMVDGAEVGTIAKNPNDWFMCWKGQFNFQIPGHVNSEIGHTLKDVKKKIEKLYYSLMKLDRSKA